MHAVARALRGPSWLAWLSLLFATQIATADPVVGPDVDECRERAAIHVTARPRPPAAALPSAGAAIDHSQHVSAAGPAIVAAAPPPAPAARGQAPRLSFPGPAPSSTPAPLHSRAPPFSVFL
jgi:hypothetical protein